MHAYVKQKDNGQQQFNETVGGKASRETLL